MKYESKQHQANASAESMYEILSKFSNLTPIIADKVEQWSADDDTCSFKVQGMTLKLRMAREEMIAQDGNYTIKVVSEDSPLPFAFWLQLKEVTPTESRLRVVADVELTMMIKMVVGSKLQEAVDRIAEQIAGGFNVGAFQAK